MPEALTEPCEGTDDVDRSTQNDEMDDAESDKAPQLGSRCAESEGQQQKMQSELSPEAEELQDNGSDPRGELQPIDIPDYLLPDAPEDAEGGQSLVLCSY